VIGVRIVDSLRITLFPLPTSATLDDEGRLVGITERTSPAVFDDLNALFRAKYGKPAASHDRPCQSNAGVRITCHDEAWNWKGIHIEVASPFETMDEALVIIMTSERFAAEQGQKIQQQRQGMKDL
jgi:hypothetical protein